MRAPVHRAAVLAPALRAAALAASLACALAAPAAAAPLPVARVLADADARVDEGDFEGALARLQAALTPDRSAADQASIQWKRGEVLVFLKRDAVAQDAFERVLELHPAFEPPRFASARVRAVFDEVRGRRSARPPSAPEPPSPLALTTGEAVAGAALHVDAAPADPRPGLRVVVHYRASAAAPWRTQELQRENGVWRGRVPTASTDAALELWAQALAPDGRVVQQAAAPAFPRTLALAAAAPAPSPAAAPAAGPAWYAQPWIWVVVGGAVAAAGVVTWLALGPPPATVDLVVEFPP